LLEHRISSDNAPRAWKTIYEKPLTGFAHGAAGIAYALLRLYAVTGDSAYKEAAQEAIDYERMHFNPEAANWRDLRYRGKEHHPNALEFQVRWCHGAAGIGLGRLGGLSILDTAQIRQDIEAALHTTENHSWVDIDHLCCGRFGRIETLLVGATKLERPELLESARQKAAVLAQTAARAGGYRLFPNLPPQVFMPTFFVGTAGIGYQLLRLAHPQLLPSVLLWE
jgi:lantibiotic modifying enzyme